MNKLRMEVEDVLGRGNSMYNIQGSVRIYEREFGVATTWNERGVKDEAGRVKQIMTIF